MDPVYHLRYARSILTSQQQRWFPDSSAPASVHSTFQASTLWRWETGPAQPSEPPLLRCAPRYVLLRPSDMCPPSDPPLKPPSLLSTPSSAPASSSSPASPSLLSPSLLASIAANPSSLFTPPPPPPVAPVPLTPQRPPSESEAAAAVPSASPEGASGAKSSSSDEDGLCNSSSSSSSSSCLTPRRRTPRGPRAPAQAHFASGDCRMPKPSALPPPPAAMTTPLRSTRQASLSLSVDSGRSPSARSTFIAASPLQPAYPEATLGSMSLHIKQLLRVSK